MAGELKGRLILVFALLAAAPGRAQTTRTPPSALLPSETHPSLVSEDPLQRQFAAKPDGGLSSFVGLPSGQSIKLESVDFSLKPAASAKTLKAGDPRTALKPAAGLLSKPEKAAKKGRPVKKALDQVKTIAKKGSGIL